MSKIILYGMDISPPVRACLLTLNALEVPFEYKIVDLFQGEQLTEEFLEHNPQHTVPVVNDNGTWVWDSHAICSYLVDKYGKTDVLYPKNLAKRAVVNQRMYFDASILFMSLRNISKPFFLNNITKVTKEKVNNVLEGYEHIEKFFDESPYLAGNNITIADFCCVATISSLGGIVKIDEKKFPKTIAWINRLSELPYYEISNQKGSKEYTTILMSKLQVPSV